MEVNLLDLAAAARAIGRGVVLISTDAEIADPDDLTIDDCLRFEQPSEMHLCHLADTEGPIELTVEDAKSELTLPELTGPAAHVRYHDGETVVLKLPMFFAKPELRAIVSPTGYASGGFSRQRKVKEHTLAIIPEQFFATGNGTFGEVALNAGVWTVGGIALSAEQTRLLGLSMWFWAGSWKRMLAPFAHENGGKSVVPCEFELMWHEGMPEGHHLYTLGNPNTVVGIDLEGAES